MADENRQPYDIPANPQVDVESLTQIEPSDEVIASFVNSYILALLTNDAALKNSVTQNSSDIAAQATALLQSTVKYGTCSTAAGTKAKTTTISDFTLTTGAMIAVSFTNGNTVAAATLNVSSTGAKTIQYRGAALKTGLLETNGTYLFVYNGTYWILIGQVTKQTVTTATLTASSWSNGVYSFESTYPVASYDIEVEPSATCQLAQLKAWGKAMIVGSATANEIKAVGTVPTVNIPVIIRATAKG